jgi:hypothetical protein
MREAIFFLIKYFVNYGIWIFGASWLLAVGSQIIFIRSGEARNANRENMPAIIKKRIYIGIVVLIVGTIFALIPIK